MPSASTLMLVLLLVLPLAVASPPEAAVQAAVAKLLANMTLAEKARQLVLEDIGTVMTNGDFDPAKAKAYMKDLGVGKFDSFGRNVDPIFGNQVQKAILESSQHGIGGILSEECQHGVQGDWHTIFPSPYTIAATFDRELLALIGEVIGTEARAGATAECWSPVCGLAREPRWGRSEEEMGEDTFLAGELAAAMVGGMTGGNRSAKASLSDQTTVAPLLKHYAVYSVPESGRNAAPAHAGRREVQEVFLPVFEKAVRAGAQGAMSSYNVSAALPSLAVLCGATQAVNST